MANGIVVLGARNLGGAILDHFLGLGWAAGAVARSADTLDRVSDRGALALEADASDLDSLRDALGRARRELGSLDAVVNAVPKTADFTRDTPREALPDQGEVARAVAFLVEQGSRALTHELSVTPSGERWVP